MKPCKLTYQQLKKMLHNANFAHDMFWDLELWDEAIRYTKIGQRILQAITNPENNYINDWRK